MFCIQDMSLLRLEHQYKFKYFWSELLEDHHWIEYAEAGIVACIVLQHKMQSLDK